MDRDLRNSAVVTLGALAGSRDYLDRVDAGCGLANFAEVSEAAGFLRALILDAGDTFVTLKTAEAVLRRKDRLGLEIVSSALAEADSSHERWILSAVVNVFGIFVDDRDAAALICQSLANGSDKAMSRGALQLIEMLSEIDPVLGPAG
ncbi:hypothetical protein [Kitasatospora sp. NPDC002040]|uniref:hypothetical protein n=1 Tax=Kitasatospora sp. NPDC002040 TaxID=3154661 RepID=UPI00332799F6